MAQVFRKAGELAGHVKEYAEIRIESARIGAVEKSAHIGGHAAAQIVVAVIFLISIVFLSLGLVYALAAWTGAIYWGFLIVGGAYLVIGAGVLIAKKWLIELPVMNSLISQLMKEEDEAN